MTKPIPDKAEVALELPDKLYIGTFERSSRFDAHLDQTGVSLTLHRTGDADARKSVHMHFHYGLFADILTHAKPGSRVSASSPMTVVVARPYVRARGTGLVRCSLWTCRD